MGKKKQQDPGPKADPDGWMGTLSDLIFLLITFFVLLITMSSLDAKKLKKAFGFFDDAVGVIRFPSSTDGGNEFMEALSPLADFVASRNGTTLNFKRPKVRRKAARKMLKRIAEGLANNSSADAIVGTLRPLAEATGGEVKIIKKTDAVEVALSSMLLFPHGTTELDEEARTILENIASILKLWGGRVDVVAAWSWHKGPSVLAMVVGETESNQVDGKNLRPILYSAAEHSISFVLRKRS